MQSHFSLLEKSLFERNEQNQELDGAEHAGEHIQLVDHSIIRVSEDESIVSSRDI